MMHSTYECEICGIDPGPGDGPRIIGIAVAPGGGLGSVAPHAAEKHLCIRCLERLADIFTQEKQKSHGG